MTVTQLLRLATCRPIFEYDQFPARFTCAPFSLNSEFAKQVLGRVPSGKANQKKMKLVEKSFDLFLCFCA